MAERVLYYLLSREPLREEVSLMQSYGRGYCISHLFHIHKYNATILYIYLQTNA